jgi:hypothetical protein
MEAQIATIRKEIDKLLKTKLRLERKKNRTEDDDFELIYIPESIKSLEKEQDKYIDRLAAEPIETKSFKDANSDYIASVTGINVNYKDWKNCGLDESVFPGTGFKEAFENVGKAFHQSNEAGRRIYLNLILSDIILRPEFEGLLRIFLELDLTAETSGPKRRKLNGRADYTVGLSKGIDIFRNKVPPEIHVVAVEAKTSVGDDKDFWQCVAEAATLYKNQVDNDKENKCVYGILSNAITWTFIYIDNDGQLWRSRNFLIELKVYLEEEVLKVYRFVHFIIKQCVDAVRSNANSFKRE